MKAFGFALLLALGAQAPALSGCDDDAPKPMPTGPVPVASLARSLGIDAGELDLGVDPPAPAGDLKAELDAFTTVDACASARSAGDPLIGDALEAIGYDTLLRDACRWLDAAKSRDAKRCGAITASTLRGRCVATVAEITGNPDACPFDVPSKPELGRDATCLAIASHDPELCAGALEWTTPVTCRALATHDVGACKKLVQPADQARCARDVQRWSAMLPPADAPPREAGAPSGTVALTGDAGGLGGDAFPIDVSRGVVVLERLEGPHFVVGKLTASGLEFIKHEPGDPKPFLVELVAPSDPKKARVERLQFEPPGRPAVDLDGSKAGALVVKVARFERRRGAPVELTVEGPLVEGVHVKVAVTTFVRDVVTASARLGAQGGGGAGGMR